MINVGYNCNCVYFLLMIIYCGGIIRLRLFNFIILFIEKYQNNVDIDVLNILQDLVDLQSIII